jgi:hypothetical protein
MVARNTTSRVLHVLTLSLMVIFLLLLTAGCDTAASTLPPSETPAVTAPPQGPAEGPFLPTTTPISHPSVLHGPANFLLQTPLSFVNVSGSTTDGNGTTTQLDAKTIESGINDEFKHLLFMIESDNKVKIYEPGATTPTAVQVTQHSNGSTELAYTQSTNSDAGSFSITFDGLLTKNHINAYYEQSFSPLLIAGVSSSDVNVAFSASIRWVSEKEIPGVPLDGTYHFTSSGGIALSWGAAPNAVAYDVYRLIPSQDQQFQFLVTVKDPVYTDNSRLAIQNAHATPGISYAIFAVGSTGIENPIDIVISTSG